ncbi:protein kinase [Pyruvatibacter sp.]|uniref:protein kinase domain-containing protein n=1 Tax=Pyruvatibacter sp. TaxID=1981328 RepID=UPI0032EBB044
MTQPSRITSFDLPPGRLIASKYEVIEKLGAGWEGEVYKVIERRTGVRRAAKLFYPHRNLKDRAVLYYAQKLDRLRDCSILIQYHNSETFRHRGSPITCLISDYVEGEILADMLARQPRGRMHHFEAMHLLHTLASGVEQIHRQREYHGDLHDGNVMVARRGVFFDVKLVDFYHWGRPSAANIRHDVVCLVRILYDAVGGRDAYAKQPQEIKDICKGMRRDLIEKAFPTAGRLREHLEGAR